VRGLQELAGVAQRVSKRFLMFPHAFQVHMQAIEELELSELAL
jgi:hypothetical protein